ncbi:zinc ribbon domain-containing protein [Aurantimonas sp. 22II-16-19i]|uniref:zinc ribbon domain-containing protein n=1 Tax=Aurantimonas sp. 22II-16-19i TaxID=1317114 RepID=UPI0009F7C433|nr:zinc ribbon domain-containing protein [Aurantimonas sp. 22II-16-19i]ORE98413.1 formamidase regulatory protein, FmdB family [Aurantimonas sp. 22II-16-19i]
MPFYDYACADCGTFTSLRPMAQAADPCACPQCGDSARRVILTAPRLATMDAGRRSAFATNERSANAPKLASQGHGGGHGAGCGCCAPSRPKAAAATAAGAAKSFPGKRPWMISH